VNDWELRLGDCLDPATGLASLADGSVDHVICDPPYDAKTHAGARGLGGNGGEHNIAIDFAALENLGHVGQSIRVSGRWVIAFCSLEQGSGTTGVAAIRLGRRCIGWERDPKYHAIAVKRLSAAREQLRMFEDAS